MKSQGSFGYYGGKSSQLKQILPLLPYRKKFMEPFCGSASVTLNRQPSNEEHINDKCDAVVSFFTAVRDHYNELIDVLSWSPRSETEFRECWNVSNDDDVVERARKFYIRVAQGRNGVYNESTSWKMSSNKYTNRKWLKDGWQQRFAYIRDRLQEVYIHNTDAIQLIELRDSKDMVIYCDPPYAHVTRQASQMYRHEMDNEDHIKLAKVLNQCESFVAVSGYRCDLYDELYSDWYRYDHGVLAISSPIEGRTKRIESLWTNQRPSGLMI